ncbi:RmlC-like cupins superfamily protein [Perilla frutescens var. frutescens]|nr:RmlC-like cupins superfamily protein [Perilla frutescens var. frutescens]
MMKTSSKQLFLLIAGVVSLFSLLVDASDPDPVQDFCVSVNETDSKVYVNGKTCKDPETVTADDFFFAGGLHEPHEILSPYGSRVTMAFERQLPGLNTQGVAVARVDFGPHGVNPPHSHPRASETLTVLEGKLYAGFSTTNPHDRDEKSKLYVKILNPGDVFVFPRGLTHFQFNVDGKKNAVAIVNFNSQNPGVVTAGKALFGTEPPIDREVLAKSFHLDEKLIKYLQSQTWMGNN